MERFRDHKFTLCLDSPLYLAVIKYQAQNGLGRSYAALSIFLEGLKVLNLIDEDVYEVYKSRYSQPLKPSFIVEDKRPRCFICGDVAVSNALSLETGMEKPVCGQHRDELRNHPKWRVI